MPSLARQDTIQSLLGKLVHLSNCIIHGKKFLAIILSTLRAMDNRLWTTIDAEFKKDVPWFLLYARAGNGVNLYIFLLYQQHGLNGIHVTLLPTPTTGFILTAIRGSSVQYTSFRLSVSS